MTGAFDGRSQYEDSLQRFRLRHDLAITVYSRKSVFWLCMNLDMRKMPLCVLTYEVIIVFRGPGRINDIGFFWFLQLMYQRSSSSSTFFWSRRHTKSCSCSNKHSFVRLRDQKVVDEGLSYRINSPFALYVIPYIPWCHRDPNGVFATGSLIIGIIVGIDALHSMMSPRP